MVQNRYYPYILSIFCLFNSQYIFAKDEGLLMPSELVKYGESKNCSQIDSNYYRREGNYGPPYVYGVLGTQKTDPEDDKYIFNSAAFWCFSNSSNDYNINIYFRNDRKSIFSCSREIPIHENKYIFPLKIIDQKWQLDDFRRVDGKSFSNKGYITTRAIVQENIFYSSTAYICYKGDWLFTLMAE